MEYRVEPGCVSTWIPQPKNPGADAARLACFHVALAAIESVVLLHSFALHGKETLNAGDNSHRLARTSYEQFGRSFLNDGAKQLPPVTTLVYLFEESSSPL